MLDLQPLIRRLELEQRRRLAGQALEAVVWGLLIATAAAASLKLVALAAPALGGPARSVGPAAVLALVLLASVTILAWSVAASPPTLTKTARRADEVLGSKERISTALEVWRARPIVEPVSLLLLREAASLAPALRPRNVGPISGPAGWPYMLAVIAAFLGVVVFAPTPTPTAPASFTATDAELTDGERGEIAQELQDIADIVENEAGRRRDDPYLRAVARTVEGLATAVNEGVDRSAALARLGALLPQTREAYGQQGAAMDSGLQSLLEQVRDRLAGRTTNEDLPPALRQPPGDPAAIAANETRPPSGPPGGPTPDGPTPERPPGERLDGTPANIFDDAYPEPDVPSPAQEFVLADQTLLGGAQNANRGAGDMAGVGVQPLLGTDETLGPPGARFDDVQLPGEPDPRGRLIKVDVTPTAELAAIADTEAVRGPWRTTPVGSVARDAIGPDYLATVARYFGHRP